MKNIDNTFMSFDKSYHEAKIVYFGCPFDGTASFKKGALLGPEEIRTASFGLETYSPYLKMDLEDDTKIIDVGDLNLQVMSLDDVLNEIKSFTQNILTDNKVPFMVGGEHLVTLPVAEAVFEKYPDLQVIHLDAHMDLRNDYEGDKLSHATVMRRIYDLVGPKRIYQFGIRSGTKEEFNFSDKYCIPNLFNLEKMADLTSQIGEKPIYVTIDLDVLDPSIFSGTGTQEPGGITFNEMIEGIKNLKGLNIVGADIVELAPNLDLSGVSTACACKVVRELALIISDNLRGYING
ncbi:MAG: agmatinase [Firmicutes bacterium]|nr:agmatinase [Bacillota bacterium]